MANAIDDENYRREIDLGVWPKSGSDINIPDQIAEPDWDDVKDLAMQAAAATMHGNMQTANDLYQHIAIEVMNTLYGPRAVAKFIQYAMSQEPPEKPRIVLG
jgi:hypothetical protein